MTIALGLLAQDGFVLASDTQETAGNFKVDTQKIQSVHVESVNWCGTCAVTGAGCAGYIDAITEQLHEAFCRDDMTMKNWPDEVRKCVRRFYRQHVIPFGFPDERLDFSLIVAAQRDGVASQLLTHRTSVRAISWHTAIGMGETVAKGLFHEFGSAIMDVRTAALLAAYFIFRVKRSVEGCGHFTQVVIVRSNRTMTVPIIASAEWERAFVALEPAIARVLRFVVGYPVLVDATETDRLRDDIVIARAEIARVVAQTLDPLLGTAIG